MADIQTYLKNILSAVYGKDVRQSIHDAIHQCYEDGKAGEQDLIAREGVEAIKANIANPNLLINGDFRNPINQRGQSSYNSGNAIDRWRVANGTTLEVQEGCIKLTQASDAEYNGRLKQFFEVALSGFLTIQVKVLECTADSHINQFGYIPSGFSGIYTYTSAELKSLENLEIFVSKGQTLTIEWIKLEHGKFATPFTTRLYAEELAICQKYYKVVKVCASSYQHDATTAYFDVQFNGMMMRKPKVTCTKNSLHKADGSTVTTSKFEMLSDYDSAHCLWYATYATMTTLPNYLRLSATFEVDAEIV